jgi:hypothetical protein
VAKVNRSFTMAMTPDQAQEIFMRDLIPDLHKDGQFAIYEERPGHIGLSDGLIDPNAVFNAREAADPDIAEGPGGAADEPVQTDVMRRGSLGISRRSGGRAERKQVPVYSKLRLWTSRRLSVDFVEDPAGSRVTISGSAPDEVATGINRLGTAGHWPETADDPHD